MRTFARTAARRAAVALLTVAGVSLLAFLAVAMMPGDALVAGMGPEDHGTVGAADLAAWRHARGLDRPVLVRYAQWGAAVLSGDFGRSLRTGRPVLDEIGEGLGPTLELNVAAFALVVLVGLPLGWAGARHPRARFDRASSIALLAAFAVPSFWLALVLQEVFAVHLRWLPLYGRTSPGGGGTVSAMAHLALPALCLALHNLAFYARMARNTAVTGWTSAHALAARGAGVGAGRVFAQHAIRPSLVPLAALAGLMLPGFAAGSVLIENVFAWPGLGFLLVASVQARDIPVVLGLTVLSGVLTVVGSFLADALGAWADPRARLHAAAP